MVMVPRKVAAEYWHRPWSDVIAAAERGHDGLCVQSPTFTPMREAEPKAESYGDNVTRYEKDLKAYTREKDHAFLREGDSFWSGRTFLYQQNW